MHWQDANATIKEDRLRCRGLKEKGFLRRNLAFELGRAIEYNGREFLSICLF